MPFNPFVKIIALVLVFIIFFFSLIDRINQASNVNTRQNALTKSINETRQESGTKISQTNQKIRDDLQGKRNTNNMEVITSNQIVNISQIQKKPIEEPTKSKKKSNSSEPNIIN